jgi:hypothetical protein
MHPDARRGVRIRIRRTALFLFIMPDLNRNYIRVSTGKREVWGWGFWDLKFHAKPEENLLIYLYYLSAGDPSQSHLTQIQ